MPNETPRPFGATDVIVILPKDEAEWHAARSLDITASIAAGLLGIHQFTTPYRIWAQKTGRMEPESVTQAMRRGSLFEPVAVEVLRDEKPSWNIEYKNDRAYYRAPALRLGATPDCFAVRPDVDGRGAVQVKTVSHEAFREHWIDHDTGDVVPPLWIAVQAIIEAKLSGCSWCAVAAFVWNRDALDMHVVDVPVNESVFRKVVRRVDEFWKFAESGDEMDPDWGRDGSVVLNVFRDSVADEVDLSQIPNIDAVCERYIELGHTIRRASQERDQLKPQLIFTLGNSERGKTPNFVVKAPTIRKSAYTIKDQIYRALRITPRRDR